MNTTAEKIKPSNDVTKSPIVLFLAAVIGAFVAGIVGWIFLQGHVERITEAKFALHHANLPHSAKGEKGDAGLRGEQGLTGPQGFKGADGKDSENTALPVGSIVASILQPSDFAKFLGNDWILADGRTVSTSTEYFKITGSRDIPDLRGVFLRGLNVGRTDGKGDPEGTDRKPGGFQPDEFRSHKHRFAYQYIGGQPPPNSSVGGGGGYPRVKVDDDTSETGGLETRPKNCAVYYYIKVSGR